MEYRPLPVGVENFSDLIEKGYYFIDKTLLIKDLLDMKGAVNLFTRPRRFGKTLNISMLKYFFEKTESGENKKLFTGLKIMSAGEKYQKEMGKYPVISISLKSMKQHSFDMAYHIFRYIVGEEYGRHWDIVGKSSYLTNEERERYLRLRDENGTEGDYAISLKFLSDCLYKCTGAQAVILIDEYDVPLENAYFEGFYDNMVSLIRSVFESALKTNDSLEFAVITKDKDTLPKPYWSNTSSNSIIRRLIEHADLPAKQEVEALIEGKTIVKPVHEDITYEDMESTQDNLWNFLFFTGYLKKIRTWLEEEITYIEMAIPNLEVRYIYKTAVLQWFDKCVSQKELTPLYESMLAGDTQKMSDILSENLMETISFYDYKESYYHGFLAGMLKNIGNYIVLSNRESGSGRPDLIVKYPSVRGKAVILEIKVSPSYQEMEEKCDEAFCQIKTRQYEKELREEGYSDILKYGVAFYKKECMIKSFA